MKSSCVFQEFEFIEHGCYTAGIFVAIKDVPNSSVLDHFNFLNIFVLPGIPNGCRIFQQGSDISFIG